jgi:hypothetical protein
MVWCVRGVVFEEAGDGYQLQKVLKVKKLRKMNR